MRKDTTTAKIMEYEVKMNPARWSGGKAISKRRYIPLLVEWCMGRE